MKLEENNLEELELELEQKLEQKQFEFNDAKRD